MFDMSDKIQDKEGGGLGTRPRNKDTLLKVSIKRPPLMDMDHGDWVIPDSQDITNQVMEENKMLKDQVKILTAKLSEAAIANEKWFKYNAKSESQASQMKERISQLEAELTKERAEHAEVKQELEELQIRQVSEDDMASSADGEQVEYLEKTNDWLTNQVGFLEDQLQHIQSKLRQKEMDEISRTEIPANDWECIRCTLVNPGDAGKCSACGYKLPKQYPETFGVLEIDGPCY